MTTTSTMSSCGLRADGVADRAAAAILPLFASSALALESSGCSAPQRHLAVPPGLTERAIIPGIPYARLWPDRDREAFVRLVVDDLEREVGCARARRLRRLIYATLTENQIPSAGYWRTTPAGLGDR